MAFEDKDDMDESLDDSIKDIDTEDINEEISSKSVSSSACEVRRRIEDYLTKKLLMDELGDDIDDLDWAIE